jgi:hypothetical protein
VLSLTAIGATPSFDTRLDAAPARALKRCADELSAQLGARVRLSGPVASGPELAPKSGMPAQRSANAWLPAFATSLNP